MKIFFLFNADIHSSRINPDDFDHSPNCYVAPPPGESFQFSSEICQHLVDIHGSATLHDDLLS